MGAYGAIVSARFRMALQYRAAALAGFGTQLWWGLIRVMIFEAFYHSSSAPQPISLPEVITYVWLGQALLALLPWNIDGEARAAVRSGSVVYELLRPLDLYWHWYGRTGATRLAAAALRAAPMFLIAGAFFHMQPPASLASGLAWLLATAGAMLLACGVSMLMAVSLLWTITGDGLVGLVSVFVVVLSGMVVPLPLFPDWAQPILNALPFRGLVDVPFRLYLGHLPPSQALLLFAQQLAWTLAFVAAGRALLSRGLRRLVVQGG